MHFSFFNNPSFSNTEMNEADNNSKIQIMSFLLGTIAILGWRLYRNCKKDLAPLWVMNISLPQPSVPVAEHRIEFRR